MLEYKVTYVLHKNGSVFRSVSYSLSLSPAGSLTDTLPIPRTHLETMGRNESSHATDYLSSRSPWGKISRSLLPPDE